MALSPLTQNPSDFFTRTAHFASLGRGQFSLSGTPAIFTSGTPVGDKHLEGLNQQKISMALETLKTGWAAKSITIPAMGLMEHEAFTYGGPTKSIAYQQNFSSLDVEFLLMGKTLTEAQSLYYFFSRWIEAIAGPGKRGGTVDENYVAASDSVAFDVEYYDNYITNADIAVFSPSAHQAITPIAPGVFQPKPVLELSLTEVYPKSVQQIQLSWDSADSPLSLFVSFGFYYAKVVG